MKTQKTIGSVRLCQPLDLNNKEKNLAMVNWDEKESVVSLAFLWHILWQSLAIVTCKNCFSIINWLF